MELIKTGLPDLVVIQPKVFGDERGYFFESFNQKKFADHGLNYNFVQDNESMSKYGVLRGLHFQHEPYAQTKLIRVIEGRIFDVAVDLRKGSPGFGKWFGIELSSENKKQLLVPKGFAHGFSVLSEVAVIAYKCDETYHPEAEGGIAYNDPQFNIDWKVENDLINLSDKDKKLPIFANSVHNFIYTR